ncbi:MAG: ATP-binding protein [Bacteroidetes bacterium]|nr:ATP-binding protein [Bacteroidota bacterium]
MTHKLRKIAITGPESTGKSMLAQQLASQFETVWVPEYAREYLELNGPSYHEEDILAIARGQLEQETKALSKASGFIFCDTEFIVTKIWSEVKYGRCHPWISEQAVNHVYDLYLLCDIDLPWESDPLREHPGMRKELFELYCNELKEMGFPFFIVSGYGPDRLRNAVGIIHEWFKDKKKHQVQIQGK